MNPTGLIQPIDSNMQLVPAYPLEKVGNTMDSGILQITCPGSLRYKHGHLFVDEHSSSVLPTLYFSFEISDARSLQEILIAARAHCTISIP